MENLPHGQIANQQALAVQAFSRSPPGGTLDGVQVPDSSLLVIDWA